MGPATSLASGSAAAPELPPELEDELLEERPASRAGPPDERVASDSVGVVAASGPGAAPSTTALEPQATNDSKNADRTSGDHEDIGGTLASGPVALVDPSRPSAR